MMRLTRVAFSCDCTSLTSTPSGWAMRPRRGRAGRESATPSCADFLSISRRFGMLETSRLEVLRSLIYAETSVDCAIR
jgi:hypothetical protein